MPTIQLILGENVFEQSAPQGALLGDVIAQSELPLEQPCAGRGTCGLCKVLNEGGLAQPDEIERKHLTPGELAVGERLACRARIEGDARVVLAPTVVYSNKIFKASSRYKTEKDAPLGLAIDLGTTTVAAFLIMLTDGEVCLGSASLNQQTIYGADVISRMAAAQRDPTDAGRLHRLALASINQAIDSLQISKRIRGRIERAIVVGNPAMHHLLVEYPVDTLAVMPFQPYATAGILDAAALMKGILKANTRVSLPPLIGGFVGSDALACLAFFNFDRAKGPMLAIDLGTNGEVLVTDGHRILVASTAAGPAFEGVNISCGTRAVDGAITHTRLEGTEFTFETIADETPIGLTGSGLISAVQQLRQAGMIEPNGRIHPQAALLIHGMQALKLTPDASLRLEQKDIRELQKAKGAIRAAVDVLLHQLSLKPEDLEQVILTGSFGGQVDIPSVLALGMVPPVPGEVIKIIPNGAGFGAASFLTETGFARGVALADQAEQVDLDLDPIFMDLFIDAMKLES